MSHPWNGSDSGSDGYGYGGGNPPYGSAYGSPYEEPSYGNPSYGAPPGGYSAPPPPPPRKGSLWWLWTLLGCGCVVILVVVLIGGCSLLVAASGGDSGTSTTSPETSSADPTTTEPDPTTSEDPTPTDPGPTDPGPTDPGPTAGPAPGEPGSREAPLPLNSGVATLPAMAGGTVDVTLGDINWDAESAMMDGNPYNDPAPEGQVYVLVPVTVTYHGPGTFTTWLELYVEFVTADGTEYTEANALSPRNAYMEPDLTDGASITFDAVYLIPAESAHQGTFLVASLGDLGQSVHFAGA